MVILADTIKGKGVSFMEEQPGWHGKAPNREELTRALDDLGLAQRLPVEELLAKAKSWQDDATRAIEAKMPRFSRDYWWNAGSAMQVKMEPTRRGFGKANRNFNFCRTFSSASSLSGLSCQNRHKIR